MRRVCVFCGSSTGQPPIYADGARRFGTALAGRGLGLVYGGGHIGLMGVIADAVRKACGEVVGVIPQALVDRELAHGGLSELHVVETMHQRKALMADRSDAFAALPGGFGTLDELCEILTWAQLGLHAKPVGVLNLAGFFDPFLAGLDRAVADGFLRPQHRLLVRVADEPEALLDLLARGPDAPPVEKWIGPGDR